MENVEHAPGVQLETPPPMPGGVAERLGDERMGHDRTGHDRTGHERMGQEGRGADAMAPEGLSRAARAYAASSAHRSLRVQEADVFRRAIAALRRAREPGTIIRARALADNNLLWSTVVDLMRDPANRLPDPLRASLVSVGLAVKREMQSPAPDIDFLITVNEDIVAGLTH